MGLMMMVMSPIGAKLSAAKGPKVTLAVGSLIIGVGYGISLPIISSGSTWSLLAVTIVCNTGVGFAYGAMPASSWVRSRSRRPPPPTVSTL